MKTIEFAADKHPEKGKGYGMVAKVDGGIKPVGPQDFSSEEAAIAAFIRAIGDHMKPLPA